MLAWTHSARGSNNPSKASAPPWSARRNTPCSFGSTIFVSPLDTLPVRNVPVIAPTLPIEGETIDSAAVSRAIAAMLKRLDLADGEQPVAIFAPWSGSATFQRLDAFCKGVVDGLAPVLAQGHPVILAGEGDVGGLIGIHMREEMKIANPIISIDGLELKEFDYIDIGAMLESSGAVPVVIKSLIFPGNAAPESEKRSVERAERLVRDDQQHQPRRSNRATGITHRQRTLRRNTDAHSDRMQHQRRQRQSRCRTSAPNPPPAIPCRAHGRGTARTHRPAPRSPRATASSRAQPPRRE